MISLKEIEKAYSDYSKEIFSYILRSVYDHDAAEDILQDVFIRLLNYSLKSNVHGDNIRALLYTIARSVCIDYSRKVSRINYGKEDAATLPDIRSGESKDSSADIMDAVNLLIDSLGEPEKSIILLKRNGLTYSEIAGVMKISERTLKRKVKSVIADLRKKLRSEGFFISRGTEESEGSLNI